MLLKILLLMVLPFSLMAKELLEKNYYITTEYVKLSTITSNKNDDLVLFKLNKDRYTKRVNSKELLKILKKHGYSSFYSTSRYIKFIKKSPVKLSQITDKVKKLYKSKYPNIKIKKIFITPRGYIKNLPKEYQVHIQEKSYLRDHGTIYIKTEQKKEIFFDYYIEADIDVLRARKNIQKGVELSFKNIIKKRIRLDKFRAMPLQKITQAKLQSKHHIKQNTILTLRDIETLNLVKRDSTVGVSLDSGGLSITFSAKALQDGKLNDIITIQKSDGKRLKARVVSKHRVEIQ